MSQRSPKQLPDRRPRKRTGTHDRIYAVVRRVPRGRVTTYGSVARLAGFAGQARLVGYALSALPTATTVPWHRIINAQGRISLSDTNGARTTQALRLSKEGIRVDSGGRISLDEFGWKSGSRSIGRFRSSRVATRGE